MMWILCYGLDSRRISAQLKTYGRFLEPHVRQRSPPPPSKHQMLEKASRGWWFVASVEFWDLMDLCQEASKLFWSSKALYVGFYFVIHQTPPKLMVVMLWIWSAGMAGPFGWTHARKMRRIWVLGFKIKGECPCVTQRAERKLSFLLRTHETPYHFNASFLHNLQL